MSDTDSATRQRGQRHPAPRDPVAHVAVDVPLAHLDRTFDYRIDEAQDELAVPGCRVRVRFAGQLVNGYLVGRSEHTEHTGRLSWLHRVTSAEPVASPELYELVRAVARRYGGTVADVLRLAIPPRHARVEAETPAPSGDPASADVDRTGWRHYRHGEAFLDALVARSAPRAVWQALPGEAWPQRIAEAAASAAGHGQGVVIVVPDHRDSDRVAAACAAMLDPAVVVTLSADLGPAERYRRWLRVNRGHARVVIGTRAAMFAPVADAGLFVVWDDGDDLHAEPRAPYPHVRDVLMHRAHAGNAGLLLGGFARTAEAHLLTTTGWAQPVVADRPEVRRRAPRIAGLGDDFELARDPAATAARLPAAAFDAARHALAADTPVLVQVPRGGYVPALACGQCRTPARCRHCAGPLALPAGGAGDAAPPACRWCGAAEPRFRCAACGSARLRAVVVGAGRTADELGRAFAGTQIRTSDGRNVLATVPDRPAVVVATPGAEPVPAAGYGAALLLDGWALLGRPDLRAAEETVRRWMAAAALVRPATDGGRVVVGADAGLPAVQALVRWDPAWHADRELADRQELRFPPVVRMASVQATAPTVAAVLDELELPESAEVLGPVPVCDPDGDLERERALIRVPRADGRALADAMATVGARRSARKDPDSVRIELDPLELI